MLAQTLAFHRDPLAFLRAGQVEFGDVFTIRLLTARPIVVAAAPDDVGGLLDADPASAHAGEARRSVLPFASPRSIFGGDGEAHRVASEHVAGTLAEGAQRDRVGGYDLPAGVDVMVPTALLHRDRRGFDGPDEFRPGRWLIARPPTAPFFPFGGGARRCVGEAVARAELATVVPAFLRTAAPVPISPAPERMVQRATVLVPRRGLLARVG